MDQFSRHSSTDYMGGSYSLHYGKRDLEIPSFY